MIDPIGVYEVGGLTIAVVPDADSWMLVLGGVPSGFEPGLTRIDEASFRVERGPFHQAVFHFDTAAGGHAGPIPFARLDGPYQQPPGYGLRPPPETPDPARDRAFTGLLTATAPGDRIRWELSYPKHEFVRWAQGLDRFLFHSSTNVAIDMFQPVRKSVELLDHAGRGNLGAVYATHDGYWSMFFAVVDRERLRGSIRNGVYHWEAPDGRTADTYNFSVEQGSLAERPFTHGATYLLPRATFRQLRVYPDGPMSDEWASEEPVRPVASLLVEPGDFPFLDQIAGHDESEFLSMLDRFGEMIAGAASYREGGGLTIDLEWSETAEAAYQQWTVLVDRYLPAVGHRLEGDGSAKTLFLDGPAAYLEGVRERLDTVIGA